MDDEFELQFADELDALEDFDVDCSSVSKGKKSLDFSTPRLEKTSEQRSKFQQPSSPGHGTSLADDSFCFEPLNKTVEESPDYIENSKISSVASKRKRQNTNDDQIRFVDEEHKDKDIPNTVAPLPKKQKLNKGESLQVMGNVSPPLPNENDIDEFKMIETGKKQCQRHSSLSENDFERKRVLSSMPATDYLPVTDDCGRRFYMVLNDDDEVKTINLHSSNPGQLLRVPVIDLKLQLEDKRYQKLLQESRRPSLFEESSEMSSFPENVLEQTKTSKIQSALWVDRYSPNRYTELLSDEATNRVVLKWLKLWDCVVFGKEKKVKLPHESNHKKGDQKFIPFSKSQQELTDELDQFDRPHFKAVLLSGPPGLGKTTLAHVISKHAGYNVVEINASDDRSAEIFKQKLEAATQMKAVLGADPRPNCLIIDEIDGSPVAAVNILLSLLKQDNQTNTKRKKRPQILMRPIICICNDLYVPALRQLRQNALVVNFPPTVPTFLAGRLMEICRKESLLTDLTTLLALCEKAENDIRSCLNTLQFVKGKNMELQLQSVTSMNLGQKDAHKSLFSTWQYIFRIPKPKRKRYINPHERCNEPLEDAQQVIGASNTSLSARFESVLQVIIAAGESEKVLQGLFENYLNSKVKDPRLHAVVKANEWLEFVDLVNKDVLHNQNYTLMRYTSYLAVAFHLLFASNNPQKVLYPHSQFENMSKLQKSEHLITSLTHDVCPAIRKNLNVVVVVTEFLPPLLEIIQPTLRPVNTQLYSSREKEELAHLIQIMIAYNMSYNQERTQDGQYTYVLDPKIDDLAKFPDQKPHKQLSYAAKQFITREIELEKMRRSENKRDEEKPIIGKQSKAVPHNSLTNKDMNHQTPLPNYKRQNLEVKAINVEEREYVDFFGRKIKRTTPEFKGRNEKRKEETIGGEIWFKFKEGFSNAVRRTVKVQDFL